MRNVIRYTLAGIGLMLCIIVPFVYWVIHPELSHMQVFEDLILFYVIGLIFLFICCFIKEKPKAFFAKGGHSLNFSEWKEINKKVIDTAKKYLPILLFIILLIPSLSYATDQKIIDQYNRLDSWIKYLENQLQASVMQQTRLRREIAVQYQKEKERRKKEQKNNLPPKDKRNPILEKETKK